MIVGVAIKYKMVYNNSIIKKEKRLLLRGNQNSKKYEKRRDNKIYK